MRALFITVAASLLISPTAAFVKVQTERQTVQTASLEFSAAAKKKAAQATKEKIEYMRAAPM